MIGVEEAAKRAVEYMKGFFPDASAIRLEEVEITDDKQFWYITLSIVESESEPNVLFPAMQFKKVKSYKIFKIFAENGEVLSMKIRELK